MPPRCAKASRTSRSSLFRHCEASEARRSNLDQQVHAELIPGTFQPVANRYNGYLMDREAQEAHRTYNGIKGLAMQDASVQESMGPIQDRTRENLVSTDNAIIMARLRLRKAAQAVTQGGRAPGLEQEAQNVRSASFIIPEEEAFAEKALDAAKVREGQPHVAV